MLNNLSLTNFKKHSSLNVDFTPGLCVVVGPNYAGKSSILDGILFALYGPQAVDGGMEVCRKWGEDRTSASLSFSIQGKEYLLKRSTSVASLTRDGELVAKSASAVNNHLETLLGTNRKRFLQMRVAKQKQTEALLTTGATELHKIIEEASGAQVITQALEILKYRTRDADAALDVLTLIDADEIQESLDRLKCDLIAITNEVGEGTEEHNRLYVYLDQLREGKTKIESQKIACDRWVSKFEHLNETLQKNQRDFDSGQLFIDGYKGITDKTCQLRVQVEDLVVSLATKEAAIKASALERKKLTQALEDAEAGLKTSQQQTEYARQKSTHYPMPTTEEKVQAARDAAASIKIDLAVAKTKLNDLSLASQEAICPTCKRPMEGVDPEEAKAAATQARASVMGLRDTLTKAEAELHSQQSSFDQWAKHDANLLRLTADTNEFLAIQKTLQPQYDALADEVDSQYLTALRATLVRARSDLEKATEINNRVEVQIGYQTERLAIVTEAKKRIVDLGDNPVTPSQDDYDKLVKSLEESTEKMQTLSRELATAKTTLAVTQERVAQHVSDLAKALDNNSRVQDLVLRRDIGQALSKFLRKHRDGFLQEAWSGVTAYASQFSQGCTGGDIEAVVRSEDGAFRYMEDGMVAPIAAASGAQSSIMGLGIQIALGKMLPTELDVLLLDEPTADMTPEVSMAAMSLIKSTGSQTIVISHRELDSSLADQVIQL